MFWGRGQDVGIKCLPEDEILNDLKASREKLNGSTVFCYSFYEFNDYSIKLAKKVNLLWLLSEKALIKIIM